MWEIFLQGHILSIAGDALTSYAAQLCSNKLQSVNVLVFFVLGKFPQKMKLKIWKWSDFEGFQCQEVRGKHYSNHNKIIFGFDYRRMAKVLSVTWVSSQIWLNLPKDVITFSLHLPMDDPMMLQTKILKTNTANPKAPTSNVWWAGPVLDHNPCGRYRA